MIKFFRKISSHSDFWPFMVIVFLGVFAGRILLTPGYFNMHDDLQMMRQLEMEKCFKDGQIPCRWIPDMGYGYGFPLFNYYPPLPYLVGQVVRLLGFTFVDTVKLVFLLSFIASGITMYLLAREFWGRLGGVLSSAFYIWAPYHAVDVYVRGAMNEAWALVWFPLILWASYGLIRERLTIVGTRGPAPSSLPASARGELRAVGIPFPRVTPRAIILTLSWAALLLTHNVMVLIFTPVFAVWCLLWLWRFGVWSKIPQLLISGIWAFGLAAFFTVPVILEKNLVHVETLTQGYYEYIAHFVNINQLFFSRFWGYGPSVWGDNDGMPFPIGHLHWILALVIGGLGILAFKKKKKISSSLLFTVYCLLFTGFAAAFMTHVRSTPIWLAFPFLSIVQFPWRFLTIVILLFSFLTGALGILLNEKAVLTKVATIMLIFVLILLNKDYFRPEKMGPLTDEEKFSRAAWELQQTAGIYDYLPRTAKIAPQGPRTTAIDIFEGDADITEIREGTNWIKVNTDVASESAVLRINIFHFPNWRIFIDGKETEISLREGDDLGRMHIAVPSGEHEVYGKLYDTFPRTTGNIISAFSWITLLTFPLWRKRFQKI